MGRRLIVTAAVGVALVMPGTASARNAGFDEASPCGAYHGMFGAPAHGVFGLQVRALARSGVYRGGFVGDNASNPACHDPGQGG